MPFSIQLFAHKDALAVSDCSRFRVFVIVLPATEKANLRKKYEVVLPATEKANLRKKYEVYKKRTVKFDF